MRHCITSEHDCKRMCVVYAEKCTCQSLLTGSSILCRFLDLPDEVKGSLPMNKENFAYILGWSDENLTGKAYSVMCNPCVSA